MTKQASNSNTLHPLEMIFMTNGCCEVATIKQIDLEQHNLEYQHSHSSCEPWYPLTKKEEVYVGEDYCQINNTLSGHMGYSVLYDGQKWQCLEFSIPYSLDNNDEEHTKESALQQHKCTLNNLLFLANKIKGKVAWTEGVSHEYEQDSSTLYSGEYTAYLLIPFSYPLVKAKSFNEWKVHLETEFTDHLVLLEQLKVNIKEDGALKVVCEAQLDINPGSTLNSIAKAVDEGLVRDLNQNMDRCDRISSSAVADSIELLINKFGGNCLLPTNAL